MTDPGAANGGDLKADLEKVTTSQAGVMGRIRNYFLTGLVVAGPLAVTIWLIWSFVSWVDSFITPLIPPAYRPETYLPWPIPGTGLVIAIVGLTLLGFLTANLVGRSLVELGEGLLSRMPIVRPIYKTMKQIFETLFSKSGSSFRKVALVEFPAPGMWSLVFISLPPGGDVAAKLPAKDGDYVSVFLQRKDLIELDISVENAMTLLISAGMVQPGADKDAQKKIAAMAATARTAQLPKAEAVD